MIMIMIISLRRVLSTVRPSCVTNTVPSDRGKLVTLIGGVCVQHSSETRVTVLLYDHSLPTICCLAIDRHDLQCYFFE